MAVVRLGCEAIVDHCDITTANAGKPYGDFYGGSPEAADAAAGGGRGQPHHISRAVQDHRGRPSSGNHQSSPTLHRQPKLVWGSADGTCMRGDDLCMGSLLCSAG